MTSKQKPTVNVGKTGLGRPVSIGFVRRCNGILITECAGNQQTPPSPFGQKVGAQIPEIYASRMSVLPSAEGKELRSRGEHGRSHSWLLWFFGSELEAYSAWQEGSN
jgi:hypothetical protein